MPSVSHRGAGSSDGRPVYDVTNFGVTGDGTTDDRAKFQAVITLAEATDGGAIIYVPDGTYRLTRFSSLDYCLLVSGDNIKIVGQSQNGTILKQAASIATSVRLLKVQGNDCEVTNLTVDGNKATQTANEHRHGVMVAAGAARPVIAGVTAQNFTGDGIYLHDSSVVTVRDVLCTDNNRNGLTMGGAISRGTITGNTFVDNAVQQLDSEPGLDSLLENILIEGNVVDGRASTDYALTIGGNYDSDLNLSHHVTVRGNSIYGSVYIAGAADVLITGNTILGHADKASVEIYRSCHRVTVRHNTIDVTYAAMTNGVVYVQGVLESFEDVPIDIVVEHNEITTNATDGYGVRTDSVRNITVRNNTITSTAATAASFAAGVYCRATVSTPEMFQEVLVENNTIKNFGKYGVWFNGATHLGAQAKIQSVTVNDNTFIDDQTVPTMTVGIALDPLAQQVQVETFCVGNTFSGVATEISYSSYVPTVVDYTASGKPVYMTTVAPNGVLSAEAGSIALKHTAGVVTNSYERVSGGVSTSWTTVA